MYQSTKKAHPSTAVRAKHQCDFTTLFEKHFDLLLEKTRMYVRDLEAAKDIVQGTFAIIWANQSHLGHTTNIAKYLEKACVNRALNYLRDQRKFTNDALQQCAVPKAESPHMALTYLELHDGIMNYIQNLPDRMRSAFLLSRFENLSYKEISRNLGVSVVTVEKTMMKTLKRLREFISRSGFRIFLLFALSSELKMSRNAVVQQPISATSVLKRLVS